jgi:hypothetical protein
MPNTPPRGFRRAAAQRLGCVNTGGSITGRDGISKTILWKKCAIIGNFADAETFPPSHTGRAAGWGLFRS